MMVTDDEFARSEGGAKGAVSAFYSFLTLIFWQTLRTDTRVSSYAAFLPAASFSSSHILVHHPTDRTGSQRRLVYSGAYELDTDTSLVQHGDGD